MRLSYLNKIRLTIYNRMNMRAIGYRLKVDPILADNLSKASSRDFFRPFLGPPTMSISVEL